MMLQRLDLFYLMEILLQLQDISKVKFNAVAKEVEPSNELGQGEFIVGRDIKEGTYKLSTNVNLNPEFSNLGWDVSLLKI